MELLLDIGRAVAGLACLAWLIGPPLGHEPANGQRGTTARECQPVVSLTPQRGPEGTRIRIRGRCFDPAHDYDSAYGVLLIRQFTRPRECELIAGGRQRFEVDADGTATGYVVVAARGNCFQRRYRRRVTPGRYRMSIGCHACRVEGGAFRVTR